jgi:hypothetical protein
VAEQLERYFVAAVGLAIAVVWSVSGSTSALACLLVAGACYGATAISQRGVPARILDATRQRFSRLLSAAAAEWARRVPAQTDRRPVRARPRPVMAARTAAYRELDTKESVAAVEYGW